MSFFTTEVVPYGSGGNFDDKGLDYEDTYEDLDADEDAFNDDTFGGPAGADRDFDFAGATAKVANVINEEQAIFSRSNTRKRPTYQPVAAPKAPAISDSTQIPALVPDMSLWGATEPTPEPSYHESYYQMPSTAPGGKKVMTLEEVEAQMLMSQRAPVQSSQSQLQNHYQPLNQLHGAMNQSMTHQFHQQLPQHTPSPGPQFGSSPMDFRGIPAHQLPPHIQQMLQQQQQSQIPQYQQTNQDRNYPQQQLLQQQQQQRMQQRELEPAAPQHGRNQYGMAPHLPAQQLQSMTETDRMRFLEEESKRLKRNHKIAQLARYNGLMTPQDKNFIQRIQLQQLVSINNTEENPHEDFYYIVHSAIRARTNPQQPLSQLAQTYLFRQGGRGNRRQDNHLQRMEQQVARAVAAAKARPKQNQLVLEGSLGKISFSNVKTPRPMLNIQKSESVLEPVKKTSLADRKSLLRAIENVYDVLLELEIHERDRAKLPPLIEGQPPSELHEEWLATKEHLTNKLYAETKMQEPINTASPHTHPFIAILSFSKMKRAMPRLFRHFDTEKRVTILTMIVVHLDSLDVVKNGIYGPDETQLPSAHREDIEVFSTNILPPLMGYMYEAPMSIVVGLLTLALDRINIRMISMTKIGLQFLTMFLSRAELLKQSGQVQEDYVLEWQAQFDRLFDTLDGCWNNCFPPNGKFVDDQYVWQFLASMAVGASMLQQQKLVAAVKDRVLENVQASRILPPELGIQKRENVNLFMRAMGLDVDLLG